MKDMQELERLVERVERLHGLEKEKCEHAGCTRSGQYVALWGVIGAIVCDRCRVQIDRDLDLRKFYDAYFIAASLRSMAVDEASFLALEQKACVVLECLRKGVLTWLSGLSEPT